MVKEENNFADVNVIDTTGVPSTQPTEQHDAIESPVEGEAPQYQPEPVYGTTEINPDGSSTTRYWTKSGHIWWDICDCEDCYWNAVETELELEREREWGPRPKKKVGKKGEKHSAKHMARDQFQESFAEDEASFVNCSLLEYSVENFRKPN
jgi:hypothetical protein